MSKTPSVYLYGTPEAGAGWLALDAARRLYGTGDPVPGQSYSEALAWAVLALVRAGHATGTAWVYEAGGERKAPVDLAAGRVAFEALAWEPAEVYHLEAQAVMDAAREQARDQAAAADAGGNARDAGGERAFEDWLRRVDRYLQARVGLAHSDLADYLWRDAFEDGDTPARAARRALAADGYGDEDELDE